MKTHLNSDFFVENTMSINNKTTHVKSFTKAPSSPHFSCFVRTATEEYSNSDYRQILDIHPFSPFTTRQPSNSEHDSLPQSTTETCSPVTSPFLSPITNSRSRLRRNTICYKIESKLGEDIDGGTSDVGDFKKNSLNPPKIQRRSSAPHLNMKEISTLARAGISTSNLLNFITVSDSLEKISKD